LRDSIEPIEGLGIGIVFRVDGLGLRVDGLGLRDRV